jgi:ubiquinone/menaquinone biosynthesis C-methylase UbiE
VSTADALPDYQPMLGAFHRGFAAELEAMIADLPLAPGLRVLDLACGDGAYAPMIARRVAPGGTVVSVDIAPAYLTLARRTAAEAGPECVAIEHVAAPVQALPFDDGAFDLAFCAQSFYSLPDPLEALRAMRRVTRPDGTAAVLENDTLHHVLLPWPVELELALRSAELAALAQETGHPRKFYVARRMARLLRSAGFTDVAVRTYATDRRGPLEGDTRSFVAEYLKDLRDRVARRLDEPTRRDLDRLADPASEDYLLDDPDLVVTCLDRLVWGRRPPAD